MMKTHFAAMANYNRWANTRPYSDVETLSPEARTRDVGVYFGSAFATLSHGLNTDRAWAFMLQGGNLPDMRLPTLPSDFPGLEVAREGQDDLLCDWMNGVDCDWLDRSFSFTSGLGDLKGMVYDGTYATTLTHLFNHQTHHRGQVHAALTILGVKELNGLDILIQGFLKE
jgi:uncharacterized damage-inducible protein DinB